jgi:hypothetical protein
MVGMLVVLLLLDLGLLGVWGPGIPYIYYSLLGSSSADDVWFLTVVLQCKSSV